MEKSTVLASVCPAVLAGTASAQQVITLGDVAPSCANYATMPSPTVASDPATVSFVNNRDAVIWIAWIDFDGNLALYDQTQPGATYAQSTFMGHRSIAIDSTDRECVFGTSITQDGASYDVN